MDGKDIKALLLESKEKSQMQIDAILRAESITREFLQERLTDYVLAKFLLERWEAEGCGFQELAQLSLAKSMKISTELVNEFDTAKSCAGTSSAMVKKVLLYMSLQKALNIELPAEKTPYISSFSELTDLVADGMKSSAFWQSRNEII